ncbi:MAG: hypothetical protein JSS89_12880 [Bacteroidetes bacterium]|nr:hypothetical protein [Bacteroidota bacterium]
MTNVPDSDAEDTLDAHPMQISEYPGMIASGAGVDSVYVLYERGRSAAVDGYKDLKRSGDKGSVKWIDKMLMQWQMQRQHFHSRANRTVVKLEYAKDDRINACYAIKAKPKAYRIFCVECVIHGHCFLIVTMICEHHGQGDEKEGGNAPQSANYKTLSTIVQSEQFKQLLDDIEETMHE